MTSGSAASGPPDATSDEHLMQLVARGDRGALGELVRRHQERVLSLAYRFAGCRETAEDVGQETFVRVLRAAATYRPEARFTTWLYRLVANLCWDRRRRAARELRLRSLRPSPPAGETPPAALERQNRIERVQQAVLGLPDRQRLAVILHRYQGLSHREIVEVTGWSEGAVESCLVRAYQNLRNVLSDLRPE